MTQIASILEHMHSAEKNATDPGDAGTIRSAKWFEFVPLVSTAAQTRTLAAPTVVGQIVVLNFVTDGGDITLTVTGGFDEAGNTSLTFSDPGQAIGLVSVALTSTTWGWRILFNEGVAGPGSAASFSVITFAGATGVPEIHIPSNVADALSIENAAGTLVAQVVTTTDAMALHTGDDVMLGVGASNDARFSWDTTDANANLMLWQLPAGGATNVPVVIIGQSIESIDMARYDGVVNPTFAWYGVGAVATGPVLEFRKSRGTVASPTVVTSGDDLFSERGYACVAAGEYVQSTEIRHECTGTVATTRGPGVISFYTATDAAPSVLTKAMSIGANQIVTFDLGITLTTTAPLTFGEGGNIVAGTSTGTKIGTATTQKFGFWNTTPVVQPTALTAAKPAFTIADAEGTPDEAIQAVTQTAPFGFVNAAELITLLYKVQNMHVRVGEIESKLEAVGLVAAN